MGNSKVEEPENYQIMCFIKFGSKERLEALRSGSLYMKNFDYFRTLESTNDKKGKGDEFEASLVMTNMNWQVYDHETGEYIGEMKATQTFAHRQ